MVVELSKVGCPRGEGRARGEDEPGKKDHGNDIILYFMYKKVIINCVTVFRLCLCKLGGIFRILYNQYSYFRISC